MGAVPAQPGGTEKLLSFETPKNLAFVALPIVLGLAARYRERSMQALRDRAEQAERSREQEARRRVDEERLRIARGVHDVVSHSMVAINVQAGVGAHLIDNDPTAAREMLLDIRRVSAETLTDLRGILGLLRESDSRTPVEPTATLGSLESVVSMLRAAGVDVALHVDVGGEPLPAEFDATAYRVVQEALTNVLRHAPGSRARVRIERTPDELAIEVADRGADGPTQVPGGTGSGLRGMAERVHAVGGDFHAGPRAEGGWSVRARLPLPTPADPVAAQEEWA